MPVFVLDVGASCIKSNPSTCDAPRIIKNAIARSSDRKLWIADQIDLCENTTRMYIKSPFDKGFLTNWDIQKEILDRLFLSENVNPLESELIITEPYFNFPNIQTSYDEFMFEEYNFSAAFRTYPASLSTFAYFNEVKKEFPNETQCPDCILVVDSGYSFTHIVPYVNGNPVRHAIKRINVGGKHLTNHLKEVISFRYYNMMDETYIINELKEAVSFVSTDFERDLKKSRELKSPFALQYVLPDFVNRNRGIIKEDHMSFNAAEEQILKMNNERFGIPESLFNPSYIGINQAGIVEAIWQSISQVDPEYQPLLSANVYITGGNAQMAGFTERIEKDLKSFCPSWYKVRVTSSETPQVSAWTGGKVLTEAFQDVYKKLKVSRWEYQEYGASIYKRKQRME